MKKQQKIVSSKMEESSSPDLLHYLRSSPSVSVLGHDMSVFDTVPIRSQRLLLSRGPSFPTLVLDTSKEHVQENHFRRSVHSRILTSSPGAFRRKKTKDGPIASMEEISKMKDLLGTMHPYKDERDIDKTHKYSRSRRVELDKMEKTNLEDYQFANMKPIEDFLLPNDSTSPRRTGYEHGHIRNIMKLDSFGPTNSRQNTRERQRSGGLLPPPNVDRYATLDAMATRSKQILSRSGSPTSISSSRPSTAQSTASIGAVSDHSSSQYLRTTQSNPELLIAPSLRSLYLQRPATPVELILPASLRRTSHQPEENRISQEERKHFDPFVKRKEYNQMVNQRAKTAAERKKFKQEVNKYVKAQQELANLERRKLRDFERHVSLAKYEP